jgi:hypothetical protein
MNHVVKLHVGDSFERWFLFKHSVDLFAILYIYIYILATCRPVMIYHRRCEFLQNSVIAWNLRFWFVEFARLMFDRMPKRDSIR